MFDILRKHAVDTVWCSPAQDNQIIVSPEKITRKGGDTVSTQVLTRRIGLPEAKKYFHVYYIGQVHPTILGLLPRSPEWTTSTWIKLTDAVNNLPLFADVYLDNGVKIPLDQVYYQYTNDRALVFCVEVQKTILVDIDQEKVYIRFYSNAFYSATESNGIALNTRVVSKRIYTTADILEVQGIQAQWQTSPGTVFSFINGQMVESVTMVNAKIGDMVECVLDSSVKRVVDLKLSELRVFTSERDQKQKYLLHYPETEVASIDYVDDVDVYLVHKAGQVTTGRLIHKNLHATLRMVTHRDYALLVENVVGVAEELTQWITDTGQAVGEFYIRLYVRNSGLFKTLPYENNRIFELYKLSDEKVFNALIGANATVPYWTAPALENSEFVKLFDAPYREIDIDLVEKAFGYNAISKVLADTPQYKDDSQVNPEAFSLPSGLWDNSTIYEYDADGVLLGWTHHTTGSLHVAQYVNCAMIEGIVGQGTDTPGLIFGTDDLQLPLYHGYRVYMCYGTIDVRNTSWIDITDTDYYKVIDGKLKWQTTDEDYVLMVKSDAYFLAYNLEITPVAGTIYFPLAQVENSLHRVLDIPGTMLDLWLNGKLLTENLDYCIEFPNIRVFNKEYLIQPAGSTPQKLTVRLTGFCETVEGKLVQGKAVADKGFIEHAVLSNNNRYDIRDDRVMSVFVDGCLKKRDDVIFSEEHAGVSISNATNGDPYVIKERLIPFRALSGTPAETLRKKSKVIDQVISDYMSLYLPEPPRDALSAIQNRHRLVSPFFCHLVNDLESGAFPRQKLQQKMTDAVVNEICKEYLPLLEHDPLNEALGVDYRFVVIHPHQLNTTILLDVESYAFLKHVVRLYGKNLITLSGHLNVNVREE